MVATVMHTKYTSSMITKGKKQKIKNLYQTNQHPALYKIKERKVSCFQLPIRPHKKGSQKHIFHHQNGLFHHFKGSIVVLFPDYLKRTQRRQPPHHLVPDTCSRALPTKQDTFDGLVGDPWQTPTITWSSLAVDENVVCSFKILFIGAALIDQGPSSLCELIYPLPPSSLPNTP